MPDPRDTTLPVGPQGGGMAALQLLFAGANEPPALLGAFANGVSTLPAELGDMGSRLQSAHAEQDWVRYGRLLRHLIDKYMRTIDQDAVLSSSDEAERFRNLLGHTLDVGVNSIVEASADLLQENQQIGLLLANWQSGRSMDALSRRVRELCHQIGVRSHSLQEQRDLLLSLFDLLLENVAELLDNSSWLQGQISAVRGLLARPLDRLSVEQTRADLRDVIYRQGLLKQGINDSKETMKALMGDFVEHVEGMAVSTGEYHDRIAGYQIAISQARNLSDLGQLMQELMQDTGRVQQQALRARDHLASAQADVQAAEQRIQQLEQELQEVTGLVRVDPLTGAFNRRGFEELMQRETARAQRGPHPLSVVLVDLDDFHHTNTEHGHGGGDKALRHLVTVLQSQLRSCDAVARLGGDEFVLVLPDTPKSEAIDTATRLKQAVAQRPVQHQDARIHVNFSAGTAQWLEGESVEALLERADRAMYTAKRDGKREMQRT